MRSVVARIVECLDRRCDAAQLPVDGAAICPVDAFEGYLADEMEPIPLENTHLETAPLSWRTYVMSVCCGEVPDSKHSISSEQWWVIPTVHQSI